MKKNYLLWVLFLGALWGTSEAGLGGILYRAHIPHASVPLTIIAFIILSFARSYLPQKGSATLIASVAMLFKFLNTPFFACHLLAIFLLGVSYDLAFSFFDARVGMLTPARSGKFDFPYIKNKALFGLAATYLGYILFALIITYVFRYHYWTAEGLPKILRYVGISGTMASLGNAIFVPVSLYLSRTLKGKAGTQLKTGLLTASVSLITAGLWILGIMRCF